MRYVIYLILAFGILCSSAKIYIPSHPKSIARQSYALSPNVLWNLAKNESNFNPNALSPDGHDRGMFQLRDTYNKIRGIQNPFDPVESYQHATKILLANFKTFKSYKLMLAAYRQGVQGVKDHGIDPISRLYVNRILKRS